MMPGDSGYYKKITGVDNKIKAFPNGNWPKLLQKYV